MATIVPRRSVKSNPPPRAQKVGAHCGVGHFAVQLNERSWISDEAAGARDWMPTEWADTLDRGDEPLTVRIRLNR